MQQISFMFLFLASIKDNLRFSQCHCRLFKFFKFFSYKLLSNTSENVLITPQNLVISEALARKYFGSSNPIRKQIILAGRNEELTMVVSGVFRKPVETTQLNFDMVRKDSDYKQESQFFLAGSRWVLQNVNNRFT